MVVGRRRKMEGERVRVQNETEVLKIIRKAFQYQTKIYKAGSRDIRSHTGKAKQGKCLYISIDENPTLDVD